MDWIILVYIWNESDPVSCCRAEGCAEQKVSMNYKYVLVAIHTGDLGQSTSHVEEVSFGWGEILYDFSIKPFLLKTKDVCVL